MPKTLSTIPRRVVLISHSPSFAQSIAQALHAMPEQWQCDHAMELDTFPMLRDTLAILWDIHTPLPAQRPSITLPLIGLGDGHPHTDFLIDSIPHAHPVIMAQNIGHILRGLGFALQHKHIAPSWTDAALSERLRSLGEIAAGVAHDLNNVLAAISGRIGIMRRKADDQISINDDLKIADSAVHNAADMVQRIQHYIRPARHTAATWINLDHTVRECLEFLRPRMPVNVIVQINVSNGPTVWANPHEVREVIINLARNALDAMGTQGTLFIGTQHDDASSTVYIRDTGPGIPYHAQERIWDPFYSTRETGSGLGLSVSRWLAEKNGATLGIEDKDVCAISGCGFVLTFNRLVREQT